MCQMCSSGFPISFHGLCLLLESLKYPEKELYLNTVVRKLRNATSTKVTVVFGVNLDRFVFLSLPDKVTAIDGLWPGQLLLC